MSFIRIAILVTYVNNNTEKNSELPGFSVARLLNRARSFLFAIKVQRGREPAGERRAPGPACTGKTQAGAQPAAREGK